MADNTDIKIVNVRVEVAAVGGAFATIYFTLQPKASREWQEIFQHNYTRHYSLSDRMTLGTDCIVLKTMESLIGPHINEKISKDVADTNAAYREIRERQAKKRAEAEARERRDAEARQKKEAELTRKLLGEHE